MPQNNQRRTTCHVVELVHPGVHRKLLAVFQKRFILNGVRLLVEGVYSSILEVVTDGSWVSDGEIDHNHYPSNWQPITYQNGLNSLCGHHPVHKTKERIVFLHFVPSTTVF